MARKIIKISLLVLLFGIINFKFFRISTFKIIEAIDNSNLTGVNLIKDEYVAVLKIPKIDLEKGFYEINSKYNDIKYGIQIVSYNERYVILASHSGNSLISYFKDLDKLNINDEINIIYKNESFAFKIRYTYEILGDNPLEILNDGLNYKLILVTCDKNNLNQKLVLVGELVQ